jgi:carbon monoxide dehydrogenase subunit G
VKIEQGIEITRRPEDVYALVADLERSPEWQPSLVRVDVDRGVEVRRVAAHERQARFEVTRNEPPRLFEIVSHAGPVRARATFELQPVTAGTRVELAVVLELGGALRLAGRMIRGRAEQEARENLERLKEILERETK